MQQGFRTINPRRARKPNNLNAISRECRSVWNERSQDEKEAKEAKEHKEGGQKGVEKKKEAKEVETPKSNVRNTTGAEARVKRHGRNVGGGGEAAEGGGGAADGKEPGRYLERSIRGTGSERYRRPTK